MSRLTDGNMDLWNYGTMELRSDGLFGLFGHGIFGLAEVILHPSTSIDP
jgi:hypothetical protein